ncbi:uncharacterized protein LOC105693840 isoform X2 [Athalia rosae]|uniref:uncharacterized protein LOC105693840 isoform X2 n=1 Tax=Athalia rosae TaxID=37344 RepID=UPI002033EC31|nr:uncharacterized protein LOC105693840 isoform X2 [Athalia rosae]
MDHRSSARLSAYPTKVQESVLEAVERQQELYELSSDWHYYKDTEYGYLKNNISYALFGVSLEDCDENDEVGSSEEEQELLRQRQQQKKITDMLFGKILEANGKRKSLYIDSEGRIYHNWTDYVVNNTLPECMMVIPMGGFYQMDPAADNTNEKTYVWLEIGPSPETKRFSPYLDVGSTVLGFGAVGVGLAALLAPVAAPIAITGIVCGAVSGTWTTARSTQQLLDRRAHQQSISPADRTARAAWFGVVGGVAGGAASGSTFLLNKAVQAGATLGTVTQATYNTIAAGNIVINGLGIGNGIYGIFTNYKESDKISYLEIGQVMAHMLFFGNAVMNFQTAQTMIKNTQQQVLQEYETSLRSNRHRKAFNRIARNTRTSNIDRTTADAEIIRGIKSIQNKDDFFAGVVRNRKTFNSAGAEVTFKDGYAMINDNLRFDPVELSQQPLEVRVNVAAAAEPLNRQSIISSEPIRMSESLFNNDVALIQDKLQFLLQNFNPITQFGTYVMELPFFSNEERVSLTKSLATIALRVVQKNSAIFTGSIDDLMCYIWQKYIVSTVNQRLTDLSIDVSSFSREVLNICRDVVRSVLDQFYDSIETFLEEIIESWERDSAFTGHNSQTCTACSGYILVDR